MSTHSSHHHEGTAILKEIAVDYRPEVLLHTPESDEIHITFDHRGGARWRSPHRFQYGTFGGRLKCPEGNTSGLNFNIYLSSLEGDKSQDEIDFEFLGKDKFSVQTNFYTVGAGNREQMHELGFDYSSDFHEYLIKWGPSVIEWFVDGNLIRKEERKEGEAWPEKPMFLYSSVWDASYIDEGKWTGEYSGCDAPYICSYRDVRIPIGNIVSEEK
ncbi:hypothetical protein LUZ60_014674 [Juncus effusus]|nr:hypothetical protein LUZ60_014674 [Juncus effusus]